MKVITAIVFLLLPVVASAQGPGEMDMQKMMQMMQEMQTCMAKVDQKELEVLEKRSEEFEAELKALCAKGKRKKAQKKAIAYSKEVMANPALKQMKECGEMAQGLMPQGQMPTSEYDDFDFSERHVCDE